MQTQEKLNDDEIAHLAVVIAHRLRQEGFYLAANRNQLCTANRIFEISREETRIRQNKGMILIPSGLGKENIFGIIQIILRQDPLQRIEIHASAFVRRLGIQTHLKGYHYLVSAICLAMENPVLLDSLYGSLYPAVAERFGVRTHCIERNIRNALESAYRNVPEQLQAAFHYKIGKPYVSEVISLAIAHLQSPELRKQLRTAGDVRTKDLP